MRAVLPSTFPVVLLCCTAAVGQTRLSCPIKIDVTRWSDKSLMHLQVGMENISNKAVRGVRFNVVFFDAAGDAHLYKDFWSIGYIIPVGGSKREVFTLNSVDEKRSEGALVRLLSLNFQDGSTWHYANEPCASQTVGEVKKGIGL